MKMRPAKNFVRNKMSAFLLANLYIAYLEVQDTNNKEILRKNKLFYFWTKMTSAKNFLRNKISVILL